MTSEKTFGYYPNKVDLSFGSISITPLDNFDDAKISVQNDPHCLNDWIYAPSQEIFELKHQKLKACPYSARVFGLPHTHRIRHERSACSEHLDFLIWAFSFFAGYRLTSSEAGFLDATPIVGRKLVDFDIRPIQFAKSIELAENYWNKKKNNRKQTKRVCAAIHTLFLAANPRLLPFESFTFAYITLDTCFKIMAEGKRDIPTSHSDRLEWMCNKINLSPVTWDLHEVRNDTFHEGLYFDEPLGFSAEPSGEMSMERRMRNLACRLLAHILGCRCEHYIQTNPESLSVRLLTL